MMKEFTGVAAVFVAFVVVILGLTWLVQGNEFFIYRTLAPKMEGVRRKVFEETKSYNQGMVQQLESLYLEHGKATDEHKDAIESVVRHRFADYDESAVPSHLRDFLNTCRRPY